MSRRPDDELLALYALDALPPEERAEIERAVEASPALAKRVAEHRATAAALAETAAVEPPDALKDRILGAAFAERAPVPRSELDAPAVVVPMRPRVARTRWVALGGLAAAAAIALALVLSLRGGDDAPVAMLEGDGGTIAVQIDGSTVHLDGDDVEAPGPGRTYQLWLVQPDQSVRSAGVFTPASDGSVDDRFEVDLGEATGLAVSLEPEGGSSPGPTGPVRFTAEL